MEGRRRFATDTEVEDGDKKHRRLGAGGRGRQGPKTGRSAIEEENKNKDMLKEKLRLGFLLRKIIFTLFITAN